MKTRRQLIQDVADDTMGSFLYYDRKEDDRLPRGSIEEAISEGEITIAGLTNKHGPGR